MGDFGQSQVIWERCSYCLFHKYRCACTPFQMVKAWFKRKSWNLWYISNKLLQFNNHCWIILEKDSFGPCSCGQLQFFGSSCSIPQRLYWQVMKRYDIRPWGITFEGGQCNYPPLPEKSGPLLFLAPHRWSSAAKAIERMSGPPSHPAVDGIAAASEAWNALFCHEAPEWRPW